MSPLNRTERQTLRAIQHSIRSAASESCAFVEQLGTVDVYYHPFNLSPDLNCAMPHKGVAWVRHEDLANAFAGLDRLGRRPRLIFMDALFPAAFRQQLELLGLAPEDERAVMAYRPLLGPDLPGETPLGRLPQITVPPVAAIIATTDLELATWLRIFRAAYYNAESVTITPGEIEPLRSAVKQGVSLFVLATYKNTPLGAARVALHPPAAHLEVVATAPFWHGMGLEQALIAAATRAALEQGNDTIFAIAPPGDQIHTYLRLGFVEVAHIVAYWRVNNETLPPAQAHVTPPSTPQGEV